MPALLPLVLLVSLPTPPAASVEELLPVEALRNGDLALPAEPEVVPGGVPWWTLRGEASVQALGEERWLLLRPGARASQPVPAYAPTVAGLEVSGRVRGPGRLTLVDGLGRRTVLEVGGGDGEAEFTLTGAELLSEPGRPPLPRFTLELSARDGAAAFTDLSVRVPLPAPGREALRAEVVADLHRTLDPWIERSLDTHGPRESGLVAGIFDAVTGELITTHASGMHPLMELLLEAVRHEPDPLWSAALERMVGDYLELCLNPETGLPRLWDPVRDVPLDERHQEIHLAFGFLIDVAEHGPEVHREAALAAAERIARSVLEHGLLPDGNVSALYRPRDGAASNEVRPLRRLDVPSRLVRLAARDGDEELLGAARDAVWTVLYTHYWPGTWDRIDPGFDDDFGHYGERSVVMARAFPGEPLFRELVDSGWAKFEVIWPQALRFGGSMAADQVRCWKLLVEYSEVREDLRPALDRILPEALHSHLKGQQYGNGAWGDVTYYQWQPAVDLQVGDYSGTPSNLLQGITSVYGSGLGPEEAELRAWFTAVTRSTFTTYEREHGLISTMRQLDGANNAGGSLRIGPALVAMLGHLTP
jgi:hypothetical protein